MQDLINFVWANAHELQHALMTWRGVCDTGQVYQSDQQPASNGAADEYEDKDGDVLMAEEDVEQLVASLQAARHASSGLDSSAGPSSISMLLFGHQVKHLYCLSCTYCVLHCCLSYSADMCHCTRY